MFPKELSIYGHITIDGSVTADALSQATLDDKQMLSEATTSSSKTTRTRPDIDSGTIGRAEPRRRSRHVLDYTEEGAARVRRRTRTHRHGSAACQRLRGNVGINMAAGDYNLQENAAVISSADGSFPAETADVHALLRVGRSGA